MPEQEAFVWGKGCNSTTPNIDRIANEGAICMKYYCSSPVSTPSRASMITGLYPQATGAPKNGMFLSDKIPTFARFHYRLRGLTQIISNIISDIIV